MLPSFPSQVVSLTHQKYTSIRMPGSNTLQQTSMYSVSETGAKVRNIYHSCKKSDKKVACLPLISYLCPRNNVSLKTKEL